MERKNGLAFSITKKLSGSWESIVSLFESGKIISIFLPESVRYKLQFNQGNIGYDEIKELISIKYDMIPIFLVAKFCQGGEKIEFIAKIIDTLNKGESYVDLCSQYLKNYDHVIDAHKLQYLSLIGFTTDNLFEKKIVEVDPEYQSIPVILLHGGLLGLRAVAKNYTQGILRDDVVGSGWSRSTKSGLVKIEEIFSFKEESYLLIDDTIQTGKTISVIEDQILVKNGSSLRCVPFIIPE